MSLSITTLNNEAAVAKTFTLISSNDKQSEWINSTDSTSTLDGRFLVKQSVIGKAKNGIALRRTLIQSKFSGASSVGADPEEVTVNMTITTPVALATLTPTLRKDLVAFVRNFITAANVDKVCQGELA